MKVDDRKGLTPGVGAVGAVQPAAGTAGPSAPSATDQVSVSDTARQLAQLKAQVGDVGQVDAAHQEKIQGLQAVMAKGNYSADLEDVARKLLRQVVGELLG